MISTSTCLMVTGAAPAPALGMASTQAASHGGRAQPAGELREVVRCVQVIERAGEVAGPHEVIPVRDAIAEGAGMVAERDTAVHTAPSLRLDQVIVGLRVQPHASPSGGSGRVAWPGAGGPS